jgi:hypothetical protein
MENGHVEHVEHAPGASPPVVSPEPAAPPAPPPKTLTIREVMTEVTEIITRELGARIGSLTDDSFNIAALMNPAALVVAYGRETPIAFASEAMQRVYRNNTLRVPVMAIVIADNDANDVEGLFIAGSEGMPQVAVPGVSYSALVRPGQELWIGVRAGSYAGAQLSLTLVPLRGRATVFGAY